MDVELKSWQPGLEGKAIVFGSVHEPLVASWATQDGSPHHYDVAVPNGIGNFIACEIAPDGGVSVLFGDPTAAQAVVDKVPGTHVAETNSGWSLSKVATPLLGDGWDDVRTDQMRSLTFHDGRRVEWHCDWQSPDGTPTHASYMAKHGIDPKTVRSFGWTDRQGNWHEESQYDGNVAEPEGGWTFSRAQQGPSRATQALRQGDSLPESLQGLRTAENGSGLNVEWVGEPGWRDDHSFILHPERRTLYVGGSGGPDSWYPGEPMHHSEIRERIPGGMDGSQPWAEGAFYDKAPFDHPTFEPYAQKDHPLWDEVENWIRTQTQTPFRRAVSDEWHFGSTKTAAHKLDWSGMSAGKGLVFPDGSVHTWDTGDNGAPHHPEYLTWQETGRWPNYNGPRQQQLREDYYRTRKEFWPFTIDGQGNYAWAWDNKGDGPPVQPHEVDERLTPLDSGEWHFGSIDGEGWKKSLSTHDGDYHEWDTMGIDGGPTHAAMLRKLNLRPDDVEQFGEFDPEFGWNYWSPQDIDAAKLNGWRFADLNKVLDEVWDFSEQPTGFYKALRMRDGRLIKWPTSEGPYGEVDGSPTHAQYMRDFDIHPNEVVEYLTLDSNGQPVGNTDTERPDWDQQKVDMLGEKHDVEDAAWQVEHRANASEVNGVYGEFDPWTRGDWGKALYHPETGSVYAWATDEDEDGWPIHETVRETLRGIHPDHGYEYGNTHSLVINPQGEVSDLHQHSKTPTSAQATQAVAALIGGTATDHGNYWDFTASAPEMWSENEDDVPPDSTVIRDRRGIHYWLPDYYRYHPEVAAHHNLGPDDIDYAWFGRRPPEGGRIDWLSLDGETNNRVNDERELWQQYGPEHWEFNAKTERTDDGRRGAGDEGEATGSGASPRRDAGPAARGQAAEPLSLVSAEARASGRRGDWRRGARVAAGQVMSSWGPGVTPAVYMFDNIDSARLHGGVHRDDHGGGADIWQIDTSPYGEHITPDPAKDEYPGAHRLDQRIHPHWLRLVEHLPPERYDDSTWHIPDPVDMTQADTQPPHQAKNLTPLRPQNPASPLSPVVPPATTADPGPCARARLARFLAAESHVDLPQRPRDTKGKGITLPNDSRGSEGLRMAESNAGQGRENVTPVTGESGYPDRDNQGPTSSAGHGFVPSGTIDHHAALADPSVLVKDGYAWQHKRGLRNRGAWDFKLPSHKEALDSGDGIGDEQINAEGMHGVPSTEVDRSVLAGAGQVQGLSSQAPATDAANGRAARGRAAADGGAYSGASSLDGVAKEPGPLRPVRGDQGPRSHGLGSSAGTGEGRSGEHAVMAGSYQGHAPGDAEVPTAVSFVPREDQSRAGAEWLWSTKVSSGTPGSPAQAGSSTENDNRGPRGIRTADGPLRYFHTTDAELSPGDIITPASERGQASQWSKLPHYDPNWVYIWEAQSGNPIVFQQHGRYDYEVEPLGPVEPDTELDPSGRLFPGSWRTPKARVIRRIEHQPGGAHFANGDPGTPAGNGGREATGGRVTGTDTILEPYTSVIEINGRRYWGEPGRGELHAEVAAAHGLGMEDIRQAFFGSVARDGQIVWYTGNPGSTVERVQKEKRLWGDFGPEGAEEWHFGSESQGSPARKGGRVLARWEADLHGGDYPEGLVPWRPGKLGKGLVSPEGRAYAWRIDENHGADGYPSHAQALTALGHGAGGDWNTFNNAWSNGWSFHQIRPDGTFARLSGPEEHHAIMKAHLPQEARCEGCGSPVDPDPAGDYGCPTCRWQGHYEQPEDEEGWHFGSDFYDDQPEPPQVHFTESLGTFYEPWGTPGSGFDNRRRVGTRPLVWDPNRNAVAIGPVNGHHSDVLHDMGWGLDWKHRMGWVRDGIVDGADLPEHVHEALAPHGIGRMRQDPDEWHFAKTANVLWTPGTWGKGLWLKDRLITWNTGTRSLNGGRPHHAEMAKAAGVPWEQFLDGIGDGSIILLQIDPNGLTTDCMHGKSVPDYVFAADPRLKRPGTLDDWRFAAANHRILAQPGVDPDVEWIVDPDGNVHTWSRQRPPEDFEGGGLGGMHHYDYLGYAGLIGNYSPHGSYTDYRNFPVMGLGGFQDVEEGDTGAEIWHHGAGSDPQRAVEIVKQVFPQATDPDEWKFGKVAAQVVQPPTAAGGPLLYYPHSGNIYIGPPGGYHHQITPGPEDQGQRAHKGGFSPDRGVTWYRPYRQDPAIHEEVSNALGVGSEQSTHDWHFGSFAEPRVVTTDVPHPAVEVEPDLAKRLTFIYDPEDHTVYEGSPGMHHADVQKHYDLPWKRGYGYGVLVKEPFQGFGGSDTPVARWAGVPKKENQPVLEYMAARHGVTAEPFDDMWTFSKQASELDQHIEEHLNLTPWQPGQYGKFVAWPHRAVIWGGGSRLKTRPHESVHHVNLSVMDQGHGPFAVGWIRPDGSAETFNAEAAQKVHELTGFTPANPDEWRFGRKASRPPEPAKPVSVYRGLNFGGLEPEDVECFHADPLAWYEELLRRNPHVQRREGFGTHWTINPQMAEDFALDREAMSGDFPLRKDHQLEHGIVLHGIVDPQHIIEPGSEDWKDYQGGDEYAQEYEDEHTIPPGAPVTIHKVVALHEPLEGGTHRSEHPVNLTHFAKQATIPQGTGDFYHVSPRANRESILQNGLTGFQRDQIGTPWTHEFYDRHQQPPGNYFFDSPEEAQAYAHLLNQKGESVNPDERWTWSGPEEPEDFWDWDDDAQTDWYEENPGEGRMRTDDRGGYDIWRADLRGHPLAPDPEARLINPHTDLGEVHDLYENQAGGYQSPPPLDQLHGDVINYYGGAPNRYFSPVDVHPSKLTLHQHMPRWDMDDETYQDAMAGSYDRESPEVWHALPWTARPQPGHESKTAADNWSVIESDFNPDETNYPAIAGNPSRSDMRVVVGYKPWGTLYVGPPGSHHGDLVGHHGLDEEIRASLPRDDRQWMFPQQEEPYDWTSQSDNFYDHADKLHFGYINDMGGYGGMGGPTPEGVTEALHRHGLLARPDGAIHHGEGYNPEEWHFGRRNPTLAAKENKTLDLDGVDKDPITGGTQVRAGSADGNEQMKTAWNLNPFAPKIPPAPGPTEGLQGVRCYFHPDRPAVRAEGFAPMCQECVMHYQQALPRAAAKQWWETAELPIELQQPHPHEYAKAVTVGDKTHVFDGNAHSHLNYVVHQLGATPDQVQHYWAQSPYGPRAWENLDRFMNDYQNIYNEVGADGVWDFNIARVANDPWPGVAEHARPFIRQGDRYDDGIGGWGKGFADSNGVQHEWHVSWPDMSPHHGDMEGRRSGVFDPVQYWIIHPDGRREIIFDQDLDDEAEQQRSWNFAKVASINVSGDARFGPVLYYPASGNVYAHGVPTHADYGRLRLLHPDDHPHGGKRGYIGANGLEWLGLMEGHPDEATSAQIAQALGVGYRRDDGGWTFSALKDDPYYDPEFESDDDWDARLEREQDEDAQRIPTDEEINARLERGIHPGERGKGLALPDGSTVFWKTDGTFGWPHHDQVLQALGIKDPGDVRFLLVDEDGNVEDANAYQDDAVWAL